MEKFANISEPKVSDFEKNYPQTFQWKIKFTNFSPQNERLEVQTTMPSFPYWCIGRG